MARDYYEVLGVGRDADGAEVKRAFRGLARELHPDVNDHDPEAEEKFKAAAEAYEVLSDPEQRQVYDTYGHEGLRSGGFPPGAGFSSVEDIFQAFFGRGFGFEVRTRPDARPGPGPPDRDLRRRGDAGHGGDDPQSRGRAGDRAARPVSRPGPSSRSAATACRAPDGGPPGDLIIAVQVIVPTNLSDEQRELAEKLDETIGPQNLGSGEGESFFSRMRRAFQ